MTEPLIKSFDQMLKQVAPNSGLTGDIAVQELTEQINRLNKSMATGNVGALQLENLDSTMTQVLFDEAWTKLFNTIPRTPSPNALYEWNRKRSYGSFRGTAGFVEGGAPTGSTSVYERNNATVRYLGERGGVTHQLSVAGGMGGYQTDPVAEENRNTTIRLLAKVERALLRGRSDIGDNSGNTVNYDGIIPWMAANASTQVIDMKGAPLTYDTLESAAFALRTTGRLLSFNKLKGFATPYVLQDFGKLKQSAERVTLAAAPGAGPYVPGTPFGGYNSQFGYVPMEDSTFLDEVENDTPLIGTADTGAPAAPGTVTGVNATDATSLLPAATYYYFAAAIKQEGESLTTASSGVAVASGEKATVTIARVTGAIAYRLYRSTTNSAASARWIATITQPGSGNASYVDLNLQRAGTGTYVLFNADEADIVVPQLAPLVKMPLAITSTTMEFLLLLYHTLAIKAPERVLVYKNIGRS